AGCWSIWGRGRAACARAMSSSPDLSRRARLALAASLVITAASLPRLSAVRRFAGGTAVPLAAGACALVVLLAARLPLGFSWGPARSRRLVADVASGFALGAVCAAGLIWDGNEARLAQLWRDDRAAAVALLAGVAAWGAAVAATRQRALGRWYAAAAGAALLPETLLSAVLRPAAPASRPASRSAAPPRSPSRSAGWCGGVAGARPPVYLSPRMFLAININNTETKVGLFRGDSLEAHWRLTTAPARTPDEWAAA